MNGIKRLACVLIVFGAAVLPARMMAGPRVSVIGDSYSTYVGVIPSGYANYYTGANNFVTSVNQQYWMRVIHALGGSLEVANAWSGSFLTLQSNNANNSMIGDARLSNLGDPDLILICAATNDSWQDLTIGEPVYHENLGDYTAEEKAQIAPAFCYLIKYLQTNKPGAEIMLVINSYDDGEARPGIKKAICDVQLEVAQHYGVMAVQCHDIRKASNHPDAEGFYTMSEQILEVYRARHRTEELVPASEYEQLATSDDPSMRVVRTEEGLAYVFTDASSAKTFTAQKDLVVLRSLVVGGGGAGGWTIGGGGAGGAVKDVRMAELPANGIVRQGETVSIQVGAGGANPYAPDLIASNTSANRILPGGNGGNSVVTFATGAITALGGGGGGSWGEQDGVSGGNGGGSAAGQVGGSGTVLNVGTVGKGSDGGYDGGKGYVSGTYDTCAPGGGAGAGGKGGDAKSGCAGNGGDAVASDILGYIEYYGGGGGGGCGNTTLTPGVPGINAGAGAEETAYIHGRNGLAGFGGGGGGGGYSATSKIDTAGGEGGSGTVILLVHELNPQAPSVSVGVASVELEAATLTLTLENVGEGAATADLYFGFALDGASRPELTKVAEGMTAGDVQQNVTGLLSSHMYRYWCIATNNLQKGSIVASGFFMTDSLIPGGIVTYSDNLIATTVAETDFDVIEIDEFRRAYVFRNTQEGKLAMLAPAKLARLLLVGGGAAGGTTMGGGGGGGEVKEIDLTDTPLWMAGDLATFTIGAGGAPSNTGSAWNGIGGAGGTTTLSFGEQNYSAIGGGGGASFKSTTVGSGASGGGAAGTTVTVGGVGTAGTNGGNRGKGSGQNDYSPGGGGGAASAGLAGVGVQAGAGGEGRVVNITGTDVVYGSGGGGGGGNNVSPGLGGTNGGAGGDKSTDKTLDVSGQPGVDGTGSGGGGGGYNSNSSISHLGGKGGDGTVIFLFNAVEDLPFTVIEAPSHLATQELPFTGLSQRPVVPESEYYSVDYGTGDWTEAGVYTLTLSLKDPDATRWSDFSTDDKVFVYTLKMMPTTTTATRIDGTTLVETWGESYQVLDEVTGKRFQIVKVTNTASAATWTVPAGVFVEYLVVGGGGAGGWTIGGGGGGGGVIADVLSPLAEATEFTMTVGAGGDPKASTANWPSGGNGEGSSLSFKGTEIQTHGGGGGAGWNAKTAPSGGASSGGNAQGSGTIVATTLYEGEMGNQGGISSGRISGGGGGAMEAGANGSSVPGKGGEGYASFITGERVVYGSGGGGGLEGSATVNRAKGGTNGGQGGYANVVGEDAVANTGSGGGGGGYSAATHGGAGASGIVVIRYKVANVVDIPEGLASQKLAYTGESLKPSVETTDDYTIEYSVGDWTSVGAYTVTLSLKDTENSIWADDESVTNKVFTYAIVKAVNSWTLAPSISKATWRESEEAGVITAAAKFGVVTIDYGATGAVMPTAVGEYVAHLAVEGNDDYSALAAVEVPFKIVADDAKLEIQVPGVYADTSRPYDATSCRPADVSTEQYTVSFEDANWTDAGAYTVTVELTDKARSIWADSQTAEDKVFTYTITRAANSWMEAPAISSASWVVGKTPGIISAEPKWGNVVISFGASGSTMPTDEGEYVAQVSVQATENWEGLGPVAVPFEILGKPILGRALRVVSTEKSGGKYSSFTLSLDDKNMPGSLYIAYGDVKGGLTTNGWEQVEKVGDYEGGVAYNQIVANLPAGLGTDYRYFRFIFVPSTFDPSLYAAQEDLIAFWDGVLNDGPGNPHADAPAAWTDIIGSKRFTFSDTKKPEALANGFRFTGSQTGSMTSEDTAATFAQAVEGTVEAAFKRSERSQCAAVLQGPVSTGISLCWLDYDKVMAGCTSGSKYCPTLSPGTGFFVTSADYSNKLATNVCVNGGAVYLIGSSYLTGITTTTALLANRGTTQPYQFKGDIYAIRLYRRPLTDEERQLNAHLDQFRYNGKEDELATATAVYNAGYVVELPNEVILSASYANWGATSANNVPMADNALVGITPTGSADWQHTERNCSTTTWTDGNLTTYGTQVKNGATMTYEFPMERSVYEFRWYVASWSARDQIRIKSLVVEDAAGNKTALYSQSFDYTSAGNKYVVFASSDGRPIAVHAKRLMLTYGTGQNDGNNIAELEARCSDEVAVGTIERVPMSVGGYLTDGISGQVSLAATRVVVRYSTDQYEVESADCPSVEVTPGADGRFSVALADMAKGVQVYVRVVAMDAETLANSSVLAFVSSPLSLAGEGGRMYFAADGSGDVIHEFTNAETVETFIAPDKNVEVSYLLVGGGGGGGGARVSNTSKSGGGGGGGSVVEAEVSVAASALCTIQVGRGGIGGILNTVQTGVSDEHNGANGGASTLLVNEVEVASAAGGGGGRASASNTTSGAGGASGENVGGTANSEGGGGGAGAGANGGSNSNGGPGGNGASVDASWGLEHKVGAGGGGGYSGNYADRGGVGGDYGGGHGASQQTLATAGSYYGAGGGGGDAYGAATSPERGIGASGANGIVLIRYTPPVPPVVFKLVERGPGFLRVECVINELDAPSAELSIASGADAEHLGAYQQCSAAAVAGDAFTNTVVGLNAATDWTFSAKVVTTAGTKYYTGVFTTTEAIASAVPTLADAAVALPDAASGTVEASAFVAWGGEKSAKCELVLKYGKVSGTYTKERVISAADIGTIRSTTTLMRGTWYAVLVARSSAGESVVSEEFELYSENQQKATMIYLK